MLPHMRQIMTQEELSELGKRVEAIKAMAGAHPAASEGAERSAQAPGSRPGGRALRPGVRPG